MLKKPTSIENEDGKVLSEEDAVGLRNEFEKLQTMMTFYKTKWIKLRMIARKEIKTCLHNKFNNKHFNPTEYDANSPRPKTSRRVPQPTPEEYTDYGVLLFTKRSSVESNTAATIQLNKLLYMMILAKYNQ